MPVLIHHPSCPHSRFIRLSLNELCVDVTLQEGHIKNTLGLPPSTLADASPPVFFEEENEIIVPGVAPILAYIEDVYGRRAPDRRLLPNSIIERVEVYRLLELFNVRFFADVTKQILIEKLYKRYIPDQFIDNAPNGAVMRLAHAHRRRYFTYMTELLSTRNWIAGKHLSYADLAAAAQLSVLDYLGDIKWEDGSFLKEWYVRIKSRPAFRSLLADRFFGAPCPTHYTDLDF